VSQIIGSSQGIHQVGALGVEGIQNTNLLSPEEFDQQFHFNILDPYVLLTYHPETVNLGENENYIQQLLEGLESIPEKVLCTMPNADTEGMIVREKLLKYERDNPDKIKCFENLGHIGYYTCMSYCKMMVGNTSSGIIEAASFDKPVVNIGDRQKGREVSGNVIHVNNVAAEIIDGYNKALELLDRTFENIYGDGKTSAKIVEILIGE
jgi:GDP/UDP-N,N'-diacetylbacillosamine 2-epimerase (hydrolysing)